MQRKETVSFDEIKRGFSAAEPRRTKGLKKADFKVKKLDESSRKFGNEAMCQGGDVFNSGV